MARALTLISTLFLLALIFACSGDEEDPGSPASEEELPLATAAIGADGGTIDTDDFSCEIPAGAFAENTELQLFESVDVHAFSSGLVSDFFRLEGLPADYSAPLTVRIQGTSEKREGLQIALGQTSFSASGGGSVLRWNMLDCETEEDWYSFELPVPAAGGDKDEEPLPPLIMGAVEDNGSVETTNGHFKISYPVGQVTVDQAIEVGTRLEMAYDIIHEMGFRCTGREWPLKVTINTDPEADDGGFQASFWGAKHCGMEINARLLTNPVETAVTCGHETFHLFQYHYDPRPERDRAKGGGFHYWLDEATSVWSERKFTTVEDYLPKVRAGLQLTPLGGLMPPDGFHGGHHGYGMSSLLLRVVADQGEDFLLPSYEGLLGGVDPVASLLAQLTTPIDEWWLGYLENEMSGGLYADVDPQVATGARTAVWAIQGDDFGPITHENGFSDLSSALYLIRLNHAQISADSALRISTSTYDMQVTVFEQTETTLTKVASAPGSLVFGGLRLLTDQGHDLMILVTSLRCEGPPFNDVLPVTTTIELIEQGDLGNLDVAYVGFDYQADWHGEGNYIDQGLSIVGTNGHFVGSTFVSEWDSVDNQGYHETGHFYATINLESHQLTDWSALKETTHDGIQLHRIYRAEGGGPYPLVENTEDALRWADSGVTAGAHVTEIFVEFTEGGEITRHLYDYQFNEDSTINLRIYDSQ